MNQGLKVILCRPKLCLVSKVVLGQCHISLVRVDTNVRLGRDKAKLSLDGQDIIVDLGHVFPHPLSKCAYVVLKMEQV